MINRGLRAVAEAPQERANRRGATARRLLGELAPHRRRLTVVFALIVVGALAQGGAPLLISHAIDQNIAHRDLSGLAQTMLLLLLVYALGVLATRGQVYGIGSVGQRVLAAL